MNRWLMLMLLATAPAAVACGATDDEETTFDISSSVLTGTVAGASFNAISGFARPALSGEGFQIEIHPVEVEDPCSFQAYQDSTRMILLSLEDASPVDVELGFGSGQTITFVYEDGDGYQNDIATTGRLMIDEVSESSIIGGLHARMGDHEVDGQFEVTVCD